MKPNPRWIQIGNLFFAGLILLTPLLATSILIKTLFNYDLSHFQFSRIRMWNDEIAYWHEVNTFKEFGFNGGYYSIQEFIARSTFFRFSVHGPAFAAFMGSLARVFGWSMDSPPLYNIAFITLGLLLFLLIAKPDLPRKIYLLVTIILLYPILFFIPSSMQESLHHALAFIIGGVLIRLFSSKQVPPVIASIGFFATIFGALLRIHWVIVLFPMIFLMRTKRDKRWFYLSTAIALILTLVLIAIFSYWVSSSTTSFLYQLTHSEFSTTRSVIIGFIKHALGNIKDYLLLASKIDSLGILQRYLIIVLSLSMVYFLYKKKMQFITPLFILASAVLTTILLNYIYGYDFRHFAPYVIITFLFLIHNIQYKDVAIILSLSLLASFIFWPKFIKNYRDYHTSHFDSDQVKWVVQTSSPALASIVYREGSEPWCNSLLTDIIWTPRLLAVPAGIGVNYIWHEDQVIPPIHSHFLFVTEDKIDKYLLTGKVEVLKTEGDRALYVQLDDGCK